MHVRYKTNKKNKEELSLAFQHSPYIDEINSVSQKQAFLIVQAMIRFTNLLLKDELKTNDISIDDFFDNANKISSILNKYVEFNYTPDSSSKYCSYSPKVDLISFFGGYLQIKQVFINSHIDNIISMLREEGLL